MDDRTRRAAVDLGLGAVLPPIAVSGYLLLVGYRPLFVEPGAYRFPVAVLSISLAVVGATLAIALRGRLRISAIGALVYLAIAPLDPLFGSPPGRFVDVGTFAADATFLAVVLVLAASAEYALRNRAVAGRLLAPGARRAAVVSGVGLALLAAGFRTSFGLAWVGPNPFARGIGPGLLALGMAVWMVLGTALLGATVGFLAARFRLATPALLVAGLFSLAAHRTWAYVASLDGAAWPWPRPRSPLHGGLVGVLALALVVGGLEYRLRRRFGGATPSPVEG